MRMFVCCCLFYFLGHGEAEAEVDDVVGRQTRFFGVPGSLKIQVEVP